MATPLRSSRMTADDVSQPTRLSPMDVHRRLQAGLAEAVVSRAGIRHEGLTAFLRQNLAGTDPSKGALLSEQPFQAATGYVSSGQRPAEFTSLLPDRKSFVSGKSVTVSVVLGGGLN